MHTINFYHFMITEIKILLNFETRSRVQMQEKEYCKISFMSIFCVEFFKRKEKHKMSLCFKGRNKWVFWIGASSDHFSKSFHIYTKLRVVMISDEMETNSRNVFDQTVKHTTFISVNFFLKKRCWTLFVTWNMYTSVTGIQKNKGTNFIESTYLSFVFKILIEMDVNIFCVLLLILVAQSSVKAQYTRCDLTRYITQIGGSLTISHPASSGSCRYKIIAPADTFIQATCSITSSCGTHVFYISRNGESDLRDNSSYCGTGNIPVTKSVGNEIVVALDTRGTLTASFSCQFSSIALTNTNCDCGWNVATKIVGGVPTRINGYVSHAVLVDRPSKDLYCGATIRKFKTI